QLCPYSHKGFPRHENGKNTRLYVRISWACPSSLTLLRVGLFAVSLLAKASQRMPLLSLTQKYFALRLLFFVFPLLYFGLKKIKKKRGCPIGQPLILKKATTYSPTDWQYHLRYRA